MVTMEDLVKGVGLPAWVCGGLQESTPPARRVAQNLFADKTAYGRLDEPRAKVLYKELIDAADKGEATWETDRDGLRRMDISDLPGRRESVGLVRMKPEDAPEGMPTSRSEMRRTGGLSIFEPSNSVLWDPDAVVKGRAFVFAAHEADIHSETAGTKGRERARRIAVAVGLCDLAKALVDRERMRRHVAPKSSGLPWKPVVCLVTAAGDWQVKRPTALMALHEQFRPTSVGASEGRTWKCGDAAPGTAGLREFCVFKWESDVGGLQVKEAVRVMGNKEVAV